MDWVRATLRVLPGEGELTKAAVGVGAESVTIMTACKLWSLPFESLTVSSKRGNTLVVNEVMLLHVPNAEHEQLLDAITRQRALYQSRTAYLQSQLDWALLQLRGDGDAELQRLREANTELRFLLRAHEQRYLRTLCPEPNPLQRLRPHTEMPKPPPDTSVSVRPICGDGRAPEPSDLARFCAHSRELGHRDFLDVKIELFLADLAKRRNTTFETEVIQAI